jgi:hypothetical protein
MIVSHSMGGDLENPTRHRDRHPHRGAGRGKVTDERVHHFPGRFACDRYAAAGRSTSFSCSSKRVRRLSSPSSARSTSVAPGLRPPSTSSALSQLIKQDPSYQNGWWANANGWNSVTSDMTPGCYNYRTTVDSYSDVAGSYGCRRGVSRVVTMPHSARCGQQTPGVYPEEQSSTASPHVLCSRRAWRRQSSSSLILRICTRSGVSVLREPTRVKNVLGVALPHDKVWACESAISRSSTTAVSPTSL